RIEERAAVNLAELVQAIFDLRGNPEVLTGATHAPEQFLVLLCAALNNVAARSNYLEPGDIVAGQSEFADGPSVAAAESEPGNPSGRCYAQWGHESVLLRLPIELAQLEPRFRPSGAASHVHSDSLHAGQIDHEPVFEDSLPCEVMATSTDRN